MPQMRSFGSFLPAPNLAQAHVAGTGIVQQEQELAAKIKLQREQMANEYAMAEMEASTKRQALAQQAMMQNQELDVEKSIKQQQIGLKERELQGEQMQIDDVIEAGAQQYRARQAMRGVVEEQLRAGKTPGEALSRGGALYGTEGNAPPSMMGDIIQTAPGGAKGPLGQPVAKDLLDEKGNKTGRQVVQTSQNQWGFVPEVKAEPVAKPTPGMQGRKLTVGNRVFDAPEFSDFEELKKESKALRKELDGDDLYEERRAFNRAKDPKAELSDRQKTQAQTYAEKLATWADMQRQIDLGKQKFSSVGSTNQLPSIKIRSIRKRE